MSTWTLMRDAEPVSSYQFDGSSLDMMDDANGYEVMDFLVHQGAPALFAPITDGVVLVGGNWSGEGVFQLVREGSRWLAPKQIEWNFRLPMMKETEHASNEAKAHC